ncbi:hypothetical protein Ais01nite_28720 [Asanoa ishikariensis]|uniref:Dolichyl-phosphate-mannose-protein mannosyltransferase n=1 Tax=Asanoa ishikariensis TaxID=137265 RepID=A0A1H3QQW7_9ACTN|nr:hypothetical protein [Asanoa ishikariensis]GIF64837.1 hypothetical protein Ais01nite_28720 [Asanoa ishikariensis]SDZ15099.1 hypothetical protein SAMN05421684_3050 [Asanoa ishikariensis]
MRVDHIVERLYRVLLGSALAVGVVGVTHVWWAGLGMWKDEASIANNLRRCYLALTGNLHYDQVAPVGWLWLEKTLLGVVGADDRVLRLPSYAGALVVLGLGAFIARRAIGRAGAVAVVALLAVSPMLLVYAGELKQYTFEAAVALALLVLGAWAHEALRWNGFSYDWRSATWVAATGVAVFVSFSAILVTAAVTMALVGLLALRRAWADAGWQAALSAPAALAAAFLVWWRHRFSFYPNQADYFVNGTAPRNAGPSELLAWLPKMWTTFVTAPMSWRFGWLVLLLMIVGVVALWRRDRLWAAMLTMVFVTAVGAAALRGFPMVGRPAIYLIAPTVLLVVAGLVGIVRAVVAGATFRGRAVVATLAVLACGLAMVRPVAGTVRKEIAAPLGKEALRDALRDVSGQVRPGDVVLVYYFGNPVTTWYSPYLDLGNDVFHVRLCQPTSPEEKKIRLYETLAGAKRVFYVQGRLNATTRRDNFDVSLRALDAIGTVQERHDAPRDRIGPHSWALVDITEAPPFSPPASPPNPCLEMY